MNHGINPQEGFCSENSDKLPSKSSSMNYQGKRIIGKYTALYVLKIITEKLLQNKTEIKWRTNDSGVYPIKNSKQLVVNECSHELRNWQKFLLIFNKKYPICNCICRTYMKVLGLSFSHVKRAKQISTKFSTSICCST